MTIVPRTPAHDGIITLLGAPTTDPMQLAVAGFLARYRGRTLDAYRLDLKAYLGWCTLHDLPPLSARRAHLELFIRYLEQRGYASATINRRFNTVALFYKFALRDELIEKDPAAFVDRPRVDKAGQRRTFLPPLQHGIFLAEAAEHGVMAHALAHLLGTRGMRIGSTCALNVSDLSREQGHLVVTFLAKGGKLTKMPLPVSAARAVEAAVGDRAAGPVLLNKRGRRMDRGAATRLIREIASAAKIDTDISPHSLRRSFITTMLAAGTPARDVQLAAGHAQISTTMIYDRRSHSYDRDAAHGLSGFLAGMKA